MVTGCAGFIGSHLTEALLARGDEVVGVDCFNDNYGRAQKLANLTRAHELDGFAFLPVDLARGELRDVVAGCDVVFHLAAEPGVRLSWGDRFEVYLRNNVLATQRLLEAVRAAGSVRLVHASSSSVYGQRAPTPTLESSPPHPFSPYGVTKLATEHLVGGYAENFGLAAVVLRLFTVYGPRQRPDMAFARFIRAADDGRPLPLLGDGGQTRDFTFVEDVVAALISAAVVEAALGGTFNIGGGTQVTLTAAIAAIADATGAHLRIDPGVSQAGDVRDTHADTTAARATLGFSPAVELAEGLRRQVAWARCAEPPHSPLPLPAGPA